MASINTSDHKYWARILSLFTQGHSYSHIAVKLTEETGRQWKSEAVRSVVRSARTSGDVAGIPPLGYIVPRDSPMMKGERKILILSDLHEPDALPIVDHIIKEHRGWDGIHFNGDTFNMDYVSSHPSNVVTPIELEFKRVYRRFDSCNGYFEDYLASPGNHEWRLKWYFDKHVDRALKPLIKKQTDPLTFVVNGFTLEDDGKEVEYKPLTNWKVTDWWFVRWGDAIVCHPHDFLSLPLRTVQETDAYFRDWGMNHRAVIMGHTHKSGSLWTSTFPKRLLIESGCLTKTHDYQVRNGKVRYRPQSIGYTELYLFNGEVDLEKTRQVQVC